MSYWLKMKGNTQNRSNGFHKIDNALNYFIKIQDVITNETDTTNSISSDCVATVMYITRSKDEANKCYIKVTIKMLKPLPF